MGLFVLVYVYRRTNIAFIGRVELLARALVCFSPISLLLVLARRLRVWMHWVTYEEFRQETSRRESVPSVTFYTEEKGRKTEK